MTAVVPRDAIRWMLFVFITAIKISLCTYMWNDGCVYNCTAPEDDQV